MTRKFEPENPIPTFEIILWITVNVLVLLLISGLFSILISLIFINFLAWLIIGGATNYFIVKNNQVIVQNYLRPWVTEIVNVENIDNLYVKNPINLAKVLVFESTNRTYGFSNNLSNNNISELIELITSQKNKTAGNNGYTQ